jgi:hypothetical protein
MFKPISLKTAFLFIILLYSSAFGQNKTRCYFDVTMLNESPTLSDYALKNLAIKCIEANIPSSMERSYDQNESMRVVLKITVIPIKNRLGEALGNAFSVYGSLRTYPTMITILMPEDQTMGYSGDIYDSIFIKQLIDDVVGNIFGKLDELKEMFMQYMNSIDNKQK